VQKVKGSMLSRSMWAMGAYVILVVAAGFAFYWMQRGVAHGLPLRYAYAVCGPSLALFTHMSYGLFAKQSLLLVPWLLCGAAEPRVVKVCLIGFTLCWLGIGWYMHDLF
jgi:hypothetical protein